MGLFPIAGWGGLSYAVLPAITLSLPFAAYIARLTRFGMIEQLDSDYVRTARAKGAAGASRSCSSMRSRTRSCRC